MSGNRRLVVGPITQGKLRGKALADALASGLKNEQYPSEVTKKAYVPKKKR